MKATNMIEIQRKPDTKVSCIKRVLLINPFVYSSKSINIGVDPVVSRHAGQEIKTGVTFPIGLAYMAATLLKAGYEVRVMDPIAERISVRQIYDASDWADAIVMPYSSVQREDIKRYFYDFRDKLRILGGGIAKYVHSYLFQNDIADIILNGEPEETIVDIVRQFPGIHNVAGIIYRTHSGDSVITQERQPVSDLDSLPFPIRNFTNPAYYWDISFFGRPTAWILPTRGCPFKCIFCAQHDVNQRNVRKRSPENIVDEIEKIIKEQGVRNFAFFDETFNLDYEFNISVCDEILKRNIKIKWWCAARPDLVTKDAVKKMKESGCIEMRFGIESANDSILDYLGKNTTVEKMRKGIQATRKAGMNYSFQCIFGSPMESEETIKNTMKFISEMKPLYVSFNVLTPLPGSMLFEQIKDKLDLVDGMKRFDILHTDFPLGKYSSEELSGIIRKAYIKYYFSFSFVSRVIEEFFKNPTMGFWMVKTLLKQSRYVYTSILKNAE